MYNDFRNYEIFEDGRIWSYKSNKWLKQSTLPNGYKKVTLTDNEGKQKTYYVHRLVYEAVTGKPIPEGYEINHRNEIKTDNIITNLELVSHKENINFGSRNNRAAKSLSKQVGAFKNCELIMSFQSITECGRQGFNKGNVSACCRNYYLREGNNKYKGFEWRYL